MDHPPPSLKAVVAIVLGADVPTLRDNVVLYAPEDEAAE